MSIAQQVEGLEKRNAALEAACGTLVNMYVANLGSKHEFICCITPRHASQMTAKQRKKCEVWAAWDAARKALSSYSFSTGLPRTKESKGEA